MTIVGTRPHVFAAGTDMGKRFDFGQNEMHGLGLRSESSYHPIGRAIDFMTADKAKGDALAEWAKTHAADYGVIEVIWWQRIWTTQRAGEGWRPMADRGSKTANHFDHVHVSFAAEPGTGIPTGSSGSTGSGSGCRSAVIIGIASLSAGVALDIATAFALGFLGG